MKLTVQNRKGKELAKIDVAGSGVADLKKAYAAKFPKFYESRQKFTLPGTGGKKDGKKVKPTALVDGKKLSDYGLKDGAVVVFKDLGAQIAWKTVFVVEYAGPLFIYLFFYFGDQLGVYGDVPVVPKHRYQDLAMYMWVAHYMKRELETLFVHRFSNGTMPIINIFKNSSYYWGAGALCGYFVNHPLYTAVENETQVLVGLGIFAVSELLNGVVHIQLRNLRPAGTKVRAIPRGILFDLCSCPNYFFEVMAWLGFNLVTQSVAGVAFMTIGALQMLVWAQGKVRRYKREFGDKYPRRSIMFPFLY